MFNIQLATHQHIEQILQLNSRYLISHLSDAQKKGGFVRIEYNKEELKRIIDSKEIIIALDDYIVTGYYLIGRKSENKTLLYQYNKALEIANGKNILSDKIGYGCQVCIDKTHRNNGLFKFMLDALNNSVNDKYSHLLCSVSDDNTVSLNTHKKNGWEQIDNLATTRFYIYKINIPTAAT